MHMHESIHKHKYMAYFYGFITPKKSKGIEPRRVCTDTLVGNKLQHRNRTANGLELVG